MASNASTAALFFIPTAFQEGLTLIAQQMAYVEIPLQTTPQVSLRD
jgi:hypothetical protein